MELTDKQKKVLEPSPRNKLVVVGRRWGKSVASASRALDIISNSLPPTTVTVYVHSHGAARRMVQLIRDLSVAGYESGPYTVKYLGGSKIEVKVFEEGGHVIFDDAFLLAKSTAIFMTPSNWGLIQGPSTDNPEFHDDEYDSLKNSLPKDAFKGEVKGEFDHGKT